MQTVYRIIAKGRPAGSPPIVSMSNDFDNVTKMKSNLEKAGWEVVVEWALVDWKPINE